MADYSLTLGDSTTIVGINLGGSAQWETSNGTKHVLNGLANSVTFSAYEYGGTPRFSVSYTAQFSIDPAYNKQNDIIASVTIQGLTTGADSASTTGYSSGVKTIGTLAAECNLNSTGHTTVSVTFQCYSSYNGTNYISSRTVTVDVNVPTYTATFLYYDNNAYEYQYTSIICSQSNPIVTMPTLSPANPFVPGRRWIYWRKGSTGSSGTICTFGSQVTLTGDTVFYADYNIASFTIYIEHPDGSTLKSFSTLYGYSTNYGTSLPTSINGYDSCSGWYSNYGGSGSLLGTSSANGSTYWSGGVWNYDNGESTLYFYPNVTSHIEYQTEHGTAPSNQTMTYSNSAYAASVPSGYDRDTYEFLYWTDGTNTYAANALVKSSSTYKPNIILTAVFRRIKATITYDGNDHGIDDTQISTYSSATYALTGTNVLGYDWKGWATTKARADAGTIDYTAGARIKAANVEPVDMTLWAVWEKVAIIVYSKQNDNKWYPGMVYYKQGNKWIVSPYGYVKIDGNWKLL